MSEFETSAQLDISVSQRSLRSARAEIEDALGDVTIDVDTGGGVSGQLNRARTDGGMAMSGGTTGGRRSVPNLLSAQLEILEEQLEHLDDLAGDGGVFQAVGGGGEDGGGLTVIGGVGGAGASGLAGSAVGLAGLGTVNAGVQYAAEEQAGPPIREWFADVGGFDSEKIGPDADPESRREATGELFSELESDLSTAISDALNVEPDAESMPRMNPPAQDEIPEMPVPTEFEPPAWLDDITNFEIGEPVWIEDPPTFGLPDRSEIPKLDPPDAGDIPKVELGDIPEQIETALDIDLDADGAERTIRQAVEDAIGNFDLERAVKDIVRDQFGL